MASEAVKILIEAEDLASAKVAQAAAKIDQNVKKIKDVGGKAKASTEFIGQLAGQLGGSEISAFAGQLGGLTEKISQFSEVSKLGGAGAMAFKAGLVGVVGALSFNVGKSIGDWWFETDRWNKELEKAIENSDRLTKKMIDLRSVQLRDDLTAIGFLDSPEDQIEAIKELIAAEQKRSGDKQAAIDREIAAQKKLAAEFNATNALRDVGINIGETSSEKMSKANIETLEKEKAAIQENIDMMNRRITKEEEFRKLAEEKAKAASDQAVLRNLEQELALLQANEEEARKLKAEYAGLKGVAAERAVELMKQADAERQVQEERKRIEAEQKSNEEKMIQGLLKRIELEDSLNQAIELRKIALEKGEEAARAAYLQNQGLIEETAKRIAAEEAAVGRLEQEKKTKEQNRQSVAPNIQATEMRLLRFGGGNEQRQIAQATQASQKHLEFIAKLTAERAAREAREPRPAKVQDIRFREVL